MKMAAFKAFFILEFKRFNNKKNFALFMLFLLISLFLVQTHIIQYNNLVESNRTYNETEKLKVRQFINYTQYGLYGFRVFFNPAPLSILFSRSGAFPELTSNVDAGERMNFYSSLKGGALFGCSVVGLMDFAGLMMLLGSLYALYAGYESLRDREYLKFISTLSGYRKTFFSIAIARAIFSLVFFLLVLGGALLLLVINGVEITAGDFHYLGIYALTTAFMLLFFFAAGMIGCTFKSKLTGVVTVISLWFFTVFFVPWTVQAFVMKSSEGIRSNANMELEKFRFLMDYEKKALHEVGMFKSGNVAAENIKELAETYWNGEFRKIQAVDEDLKNQIIRNIRHYEITSLFLPSTFYLLTNNALSSKGYESFIDFYSYVQAMKEEFLRFYIDRKFYTDYTTVEPFADEKKRTYCSGSRLPGFFGIGITMMAIYILGGFAVSYFRFKASLFPAPPAEKVKDLDGLDIELKKGETYVMLTDGCAVGNQLYNFFSGRAKGFNGRVRLNDIDQADMMKSAAGYFVYLCRPGKVPQDIKTGDFLAFLRRILKISNKTMAQLYIRLGIEHIEAGRFGGLPIEDTARILLETARLKGSTVYMLQDFTRGMPPAFLKRFPEELQKLKKSDTAILYLTDDVLLASRIGDSAGFLQAAEGLKLENYDLV
jgi:ABC-type Na+ transport system ATPase subunit NatA